MKTPKATLRRKPKPKSLCLTKNFISYRKYRNYRRFVHSDLL